jgi:hypothetical protein
MEVLGCKSLGITLCFVLAGPAMAQFSARQTDFLKTVKGFTGSLDIHGVGEGSVTAAVGSTEFTSDQHVVGTLNLTGFDALTGSWVGSLNGTITIQEKSVTSIAGCAITTTYVASTSAQTDFRGAPITWHLSLDTLNGDTWSLWPDNSSVNGTTTAVTCTGQSSSATNPMRFAPQSTRMGFPLPAVGYDLKGTSTATNPAGGNAAGNLVTYTFTYDLKANTGQPHITVATNPPGLRIAVDGASLVAPQTFSWDPGSAHSIGATSPQGIGTLFTFDSWSDGGNQTHTITTPSQDTTYTARFNAQYLLTGIVSPAAAGTITSDPCCTNGYFDNGTPVNVTAVPNCGFTFANWTSDLSGPTNPQTITITGPKTVTANFTSNGANCTNQKAQLSGPPPGSALGGSSATFSWGAISGAAGYYLQIGTFAGGGNLFSGGTGLNASQLVNNLPLNCAAIYARLGTLLGGVWQYADATYKCANASSLAQMISPSPGSILSSPDVTFTWSAATGATSYWLDVGGNAGGVDLFSQSAGLATSQAISLPADGRTLYVRLWTQTGSQWQYNDYTYIAGAAAHKAEMLIPTPGTTLTGTSVTFTWSAGTGATSYWLDVGGNAGGFDLFTQNAGVATSLTAAGLPNTGGTVYVRLWTAFGSAWQFNDYTYTSGAAATKAVMLTPPPGSGLSGSTVTFTWSAGTGAASYWLDVGSSAGGYDLYSQSAGFGTSQTAAGLPSDGSTVYVRLWTQFGTTWQYNDYTFKASGGPVKAVMISPTPGSVLSGATVTFTWSAGTGAASYWLDVGSSAGGSDLFSQGSGLVTSQPAITLPTNGSTVYVRLWTQFGTTWQYNDYTYTAGH